MVKESPFKNFMSFYCILFAINTKKKMFQHLRLGSIFNIYLTFRQFQPQNSYQKDSYIRKNVKKIKNKNKTCIYRDILRFHALSVSTKNTCSKMEMCSNNCCSFGKKAFPISFVVTINALKQTPENLNVKVVYMEVGRVIYNCL